MSCRFQSRDSPPHLYRLKKLNYQSVSFVSLEFPRAPGLPVATKVNTGGRAKVRRDPGANSRRQPPGGRRQWQRERRRSTGKDPTAKATCACSLGSLHTAWGQMHAAWGLEHTAWGQLHIAWSPCTQPGASSTQPGVSCTQPGASSTQSGVWGTQPAA